MRYNLVCSITKAPHRGVECVLRNRAFWAPGAWKNKTAMACDSMQLAQYGQDLLRQRYVEATAHLVVAGRNSPHRIVEIEFSPLGARKLTWPGENQRQELQPSFGFGLAGKAIDGTKESAERNRVEDGRSVFDFRGEQGATQRDGGIVRGTSGCDGELKDLADGRAEPACRFRACRAFLRCEAPREFRRR